MLVAHALPPLTYHPAAQPAARTRPVWCAHPALNTAKNNLLCQVVFFDPVTGREQASFDHGADPSARAFGCIAANPAGDAAVAGAYDRLYVFTKAGPRGVWQAAGVKQVRMQCVCGRQRLHAITGASLIKVGNPQVN